MAFARDIDVDMFYDGDRDEYCCLRCQFTGSEEDILKANDIIRLRYKDMMKRHTVESFYE